MVGSPRGRAWPAARTVRSRKECRDTSPRRPHELQPAAAAGSGPTAGRQLVRQPGPRALGQHDRVSVSGNPNNAGAADNEDMQSDTSSFDI